MTTGTEKRTGMRKAVIQLSVVAAYLGAIVAANLITTHYAKLGHPEVSVYTAFGLIAFDFVARDLLHDVWQGRQRWIGLLALVTAGSVVSYLVNPDSARIALASTAAFATAFALDTLVYSLVHRLPWLERSNISNVFAAIGDSAVFVAIAFPGPFLFAVFFGQVTAKIAGGIVFSLVFQRLRAQTVA